MKLIQFIVTVPQLTCNRSFGLLRSKSTLAGSSEFLAERNGAVNLLSKCKVCTKEARSIYLWFSTKHVTRSNTHQTHRNLTARVTLCKGIVLVMFCLELRQAALCFAFVKHVVSEYDQWKSSTNQEKSVLNITR